MATRQVKTLLLIIGLALVLPQCSDFRAIFNGKSSPKVAHKSKAPKSKSKKKHNQPPPDYAKSLFIWPLSAPISSGYGPRWGKFHEGIDIDGDFGDSVVAAAEGEVVYSSKLGGYGNLIVIKHQKGFFTAYAHNKKNLVKRGKRVHQGEKIALVGSTGSSTGSHLHFEVRDKSGTYDPLAFLPSKRYLTRR